MRLPLAQIVPYPDSCKPLGFLVTMTLGDDSWTYNHNFMIKPKTSPFNPSQEVDPLPFDAAHHAAIRFIQILALFFVWVHYVFISCDMVSCLLNDYLFSFSIYFFISIPLVIYCLLDKGSIHFREWFRICGMRLMIFH
jgi:hypothetical protein